MDTDKTDKNIQTHNGCDHNQLMQIWNEIIEQPAWRARADKECDYYDGNQLDAEILRQQELKGIPPSIENLIGRTVDDICGMEAKNRTDWKVSPESGVSDDDVAEVFNQKLNKAERESGADIACTKAYNALVKVGVGWVEVRRENNPFKFPYKVSFVHRNEIWWDMTSREPDLSDCMWLVRRKWVPLHVAELLFPGKKELIRSIGTGWQTDDIASMSIEGGKDTGLMAALDIERGWTIEEQEWRNIQSRMVCVFEVLTREYRNADIIALGNGRIVEFDKDNPLHIMSVCKCGKDIKKAVVSDIWKTYFVGPHIVGKIKVESASGLFPYVPFFGNREDRTGVPYGIIRNLMYLQDETNARISKMQWGLAAVRTERTENAVMMSDEALRQTIGRYDADIVLNKKEMVSGGIFRVERDFQLNQQQYERLLDLRRSFQTVSGVSDAFRGQGGSNSTASGLQAQIEQSVQALATINDNFRYARSLVGRLLLDLIIADSTEREEVVIAGGLVKDDRVVVINEEVIDDDGLRYKNNDVQKARLKVALSEIPSTPSFRQQQLTAMSEAFKSAPPQYQAIMMPHLTSLMDIPNKAEIVKAIRMVSNSPTPDQIEEQIKNAVSDALANSDREIKLRELEIKEKKTNAEIEKILNEAVNKAVESMYSAMQAAGVIAATPATAPLADQVLESSGFTDKGKPPLVPVFPQNFQKNAVIAVMPSQNGPLNDSNDGNDGKIPKVQSPSGSLDGPDIGLSTPGVGEQQGIETERFEDNVPKP